LLSHVNLCRYIEGFPVADCLREFLLREESENYELFSTEERSEFLFRLLSHCCLGGSMCQFEGGVFSLSLPGVTRGPYRRSSIELGLSLPGVRWLHGPCWFSSGVLTAN
jgi:hypothetical protein